jgi:hypothetical protein
MTKTGLLIVFGVVALLMISLGITIFRFGTSSANTRAASDFYERHPDWTWSVPAPTAAYTDYFERHPELIIAAVGNSGASDYYERHPELSGYPPTQVDLTDYYFRHPEQTGFPNPAADPAD